MTSRNYKAFGHDNHWSRPRSKVHGNCSHLSEQEGYNDKVWRFRLKPSSCRAPKTPNRVKVGFGRCLSQPDRIYFCHVWRRSKRSWKRCQFESHDSWPARTALEVFLFENVAPQSTNLKDVRNISCFSLAMYFTLHVLFKW